MSFTNADIALATSELSKAGMSPADIADGGLEGTLALAGAGALGLTDSAAITAATQAAFGLKGSAIPQLNDILTGGE